jgi:hypothetical protein
MNLNGDPRYATPGRTNDASPSSSRIASPFPAKVGVIDDGRGRAVFQHRGRSNLDCRFGNWIESQRAGKL